MKISLQFLLLATALAVATAHFAKNERTPQHIDISHPKSLSDWDKAKLFMTKMVSPQLFQDVPKETMAELQDYFIYPPINNFFIDARQLFTQAKKISPTGNLPELRWGHTWSFCFWICPDIETKYSTKDSRILGGDTITSKTKITPTHIENIFDIGLFNWTSPGFLINVTDFTNEKIHLTKRSFYAFENVTIAFGSDYGFVPGVGIQLDNLTIHYDAGKVRGAVQELTVWDFEGNLLEQRETDPEDFKIDEFMQDNWNWVKREYTQGLQFMLNCFLSNGRSDPEKCLYDDDENDPTGLRRSYLSFLNMQLIQTIGLGALLE